jgi:hypothetical protein
LPKAKGISLFGLFVGDDVKKVLEVWILKKMHKKVFRLRPSIWKQKMYSRFFYWHWNLRLTLDKSPNCISRERKGGEREKKEEKGEEDRGREIKEELWMKERGNKWGRKERERTRER